MKQNKKLLKSFLLGDTLMKHSHERQAVTVFDNKKNVREQSFSILSREDFVQLTIGGLVRNYHTQKHVPCSAFSCGVGISGSSGTSGTTRAFGEDGYGTEQMNLEAIKLVGSFFTEPDEWYKCID